jgi:hypothetical protein
VAALLSIIVFSSAVRGDEQAFKRLACIDHSNGPVDFIRNGEEKPLRFFKFSYTEGDRGRVAFYNWDEQRKQYATGGAEQVRASEFIDSYAGRGVVFLKDLEKAFDDAENMPYSFTVFSKQLQVDGWMGRGGQRYSIYATVKTTNTCDESAVLTVYEDNGGSLRCVYEDTLIPSSARLHIQKLAVCDLNRDSFPEILIGIFNADRQSCGIFVYGLDDNPWVPQVIQ